MGLLLPHKRTLSLWPDMVSLSINCDHAHVGGGKRNEITGFSKDSRYRLFRLLHGVRFTTISFCTLTYGETFPHDAHRAKAHLKAYRRTFERNYGKHRAIWRMELQQRGAPHFHILYLDLPFICISDWQNIWYRAAKIPKAEQYGNALDVRFNKEKKDSKLIGYYLAKYISKNIGNDDTNLYRHIGRFWGRWNIEEPEPERIVLTAMEADMLGKMLLARKDGEKWTPFDIQTFTSFGAQMGSDDYKQIVSKLVTNLLERTRRVERHNVTFSTTNLVQTGVR